MVTGKRKKSGVDRSSSPSTPPPSKKRRSVRRVGNCGDRVPGPPPPSEVMPAAASVAKVFSEETLLEKILNYAVHINQGKLFAPMVAVVRSVQKSWLRGTTKLLLKLEEPVIVLDERNLPSKLKEVKEKERRNKPVLSFKRFAEVFSHSSRINQKHFLPFKLIMECESFRRENYLDVVECLKQAGVELTELEIRYPVDGMGMPRLNLLFLRKLIFQLWDEKPERNRLFKEYYLNPGSSLQRILLGSKGLKELVFPHSNITSETVPQDLEFLRLPDSIVLLDIELKLESEVLDALVMQLPKLEHLRIRTHEIAYQDDFLFRILEKVKDTLVSFRVEGLWRTGGKDPCPKSYLRFPVMTKLETVCLDSGECELGPGPEINNFKECISKLHHLELACQTESMLEKWLDSYESDNVEELTISVVDETLENYYLSINPEQMAKVKRGFPNLRVLVLDLNVGDLEVLKYLFGNMKQLQSFQINLRGDIGSDGGPKVDGVMLGRPLEMLKALEILQSYGEDVTVQLNENWPCIMDLAELESLNLWTDNWSDAEPEEERKSLISDLVFKLALLKMPKLRNLGLYGKFKPSEAMIAKWKEEEGRVIDYSPELV